MTPKPGQMSMTAVYQSQNSPLRSEDTARRAGPGKDGAQEQREQTETVGVRLCRSKWITPEDMITCLNDFQASTEVKPSRLRTKYRRSS